MCWSAVRHVAAACALGFVPWRVTQAQETRDSSGVVAGVRAASQSGSSAWGMLNYWNPGAPGTTSEYSERIGASRGMEGSAGFRFSPLLTLYTSAGSTDGSGSRQGISIAQHLREATSTLRAQWPRHRWRPFIEAGYGKRDVVEGSGTHAIWPETGYIQGRLFFGGTGVMVELPSGFAFEVAAQFRHSVIDRIVITTERTWPPYGYNNVDHDEVQSASVERRMYAGISWQAPGLRVAPAAASPWVAGLEDPPVKELSVVRVHVGETQIRGTAVLVNADTVAVQTIGDHGLRQTVIPTRCITALSVAEGRQPRPAQLLRSVGQAFALVSAVMLVPVRAKPNDHASPIGQMMPEVVGVSLVGGALLHAFRDQTLWREIPLASERPSTLPLNKCAVGARSPGMR